MRISHDDFMEDCKNYLKSNIVLYVECNKGR